MHHYSGSCSRGLPRSVGLNEGCTNSHFPETGNPWGKVSVNFTKFGKFQKFRPQLFLIHYKLLIWVESVREGNGNGCEQRLFSILCSFCFGWTQVPGMSLRSCDIWKQSQHIHRSVRNQVSNWKQTSPMWKILSHFLSVVVGPMLSKSRKWDVQSLSEIFPSLARKWLFFARNGFPLPPKML